MEAKKNSQSVSKKVITVCLVLTMALVAGAAVAGYSIGKTKGETPVVVQKQADAHTAFILDIYDVIKTEYWQQISDQQLSQAFQTATQTMLGGVALPSEDRNGVEKMVGEALQKVKADQKDRFVTQLANVTLQSLQPVGRSSLYSSEEAQNLSNTVNNIDPQVDLFSVLGVTQASDSTQVESAYMTKRTAVEQLADLPEEEKQQQLQLLERARNTLTTDESKTQYSTSGVEPTFSYNLVSPDIVYLHLKQFSPTTPHDLQGVLQQMNQSARPTSMILDLRGNIGGAIDGLPLLLAPFIGSNVHAYDFFKQGNITQFKTSNLALDELKQFKQIVVLIDGNTQSSAEVMAAVIKKYNAGVVVGSTTKGWGTVERVFPIEKQLNKNVQYSVFLVHSLTVREDGEVIEGNGVKPDIELSNPAWENELFSYFRNQELVDSVRQLTVQ